MATEDEEILYGLSDWDVTVKKTAQDQLAKMKRIDSLPFPLDTHIGFYGGTGTGKSFDALAYARRIVAENQGHAIYFDWKRDTENIPDEERIFIPERLEEVRIPADEKQCVFRVVNSRGSGEVFARLAHIITNLKSDGVIKRPVYLVFDEIDAYQYRGRVGDVHPILNVFRQGRGIGVHGIAVTPRPQDIDKAIMDNCMDGIVVGRIKKEAIPRMRARYDLEITPAVRLWTSQSIPHPSKPGKKIFPFKAMYDDILDDWVLIDKKAKGEAK